MVTQTLERSFNLVCFDLSIYGHHPHYILQLCRGWGETQPAGKLYFVVSPEFLTVHADVVHECNGVSAVEFVAVSHAEYAALKPRRSGIDRNLRNFQEWQLFAQYANQLQADHGVILYLDTCLLPMALGQSFPCPFSGIYFRPTFHYHTFTPQPLTSRDRLQVWREKWILARALRHPQFRTLLSLDPIAPHHIPLPNHRVRAIALADPVDLSQPRLTSQANVRQTLGIEGDRTVFLLFGALTARKGIYPLLQSLEQLPHAIAQNVCLVLLGEASSEVQQRITDSITTLRQRTPLQIITRYEFVDEVELHEHIAMADVVLALYQKHVGMSGILMQAALHQKPVLSSDYGLMGELVRRYELGVAIDSTLPGEIAKGISLYVEAPQTVKVDVQKMNQLVSENSATLFYQTIFQEAMNQP